MGTRRDGTADGDRAPRFPLSARLGLTLALLVAVAAAAAIVLGWWLLRTAPDREVPPERDVPPEREVPDAVAAQALAVSPDGRFLRLSDGRPFFWLGDTAWELFHRLDREEAEAYLENRRAKGFTVVQAVALAELGGTTRPNAYGHLPLVDRDPARPDVADGPDDDYWDHVDAVVEMAEERGLYVALLPTWGNKVDVAWGGDGDEPIFDVRNAREYGRFVGERYADQANIIWLLGGDRGPDGEHMPIWNAMAEGIREGDGGAHLVAYHPSGGRSSSPFTHDDPRYDLNLVQSGHCADIEEALDLVVDDHALDPPKPTLDAEPRYEDHPKCWEPEQGWWDEHDVRRIAWFQTFAGAFGHTYGNHNIWQFWEPGRSRVSSARTPWREALDQPGAGQVQHVRWLLESRPWWTAVPDQGLVAGEPGSGEGMVRALRSTDGAFALLYTGHGEDVTVDLGGLPAERVRTWWYDPRTGSASEGEVIDNDGGERTFDPPGEPGRTNDWVLVLDDAARELPPPGR